MSNASIQKIMTDNKALFTELVRSGISNSELARKFSEGISEVVSVPQVARFKREFGLIKTTEKPPELVIEKLPRSAASLDRVLSLLFAAQVETLEKYGMKLQVKDKIFDVDGKAMSLDELNSLIDKKSEEINQNREKEEAIAKLKALGVSKEELLKLLKTV